jgi:ribosome-binding factor A
MAPARRRARSSATRQYPRTARLNQLLREIIAESLEDIDDERLEFVTITSGVGDAHLHRALVFYDSLAGEEGDPIVLEALDEHRRRVQMTVGREARIKRTPELSFQPDPAVRFGSRIESILADIAPVGDAAAEAGDGAAGAEGADGGEGGLSGGELPGGDAEPTAGDPPGPGD